MYDCPGCGLKESCFGEYMCGSCESKYRESERILCEDERKFFLEELENCLCSDGDCYECRNRCACLAELRGDYSAAESILNQ